LSAMPTASRGNAAAPADSDLAPAQTPAGERTLARTNQAPPICCAHTTTTRPVRPTAIAGRPIAAVAPEIESGALNVPPGGRVAATMCGTPAIVAGHATCAVPSALNPTTGVSVAPEPTGVNPSHDGAAPAGDAHTSTASTARTVERTCRRP
jgi:hypothetical protein